MTTIERQTPLHIRVVEVHEVFDRNRKLRRPIPSGGGHVVDDTETMKKPTTNWKTTDRRLVIFVMFLLLFSTMMTATTISTTMKIFGNVVEAFQYRTTSYPPTGLEKHNWFDPSSIRYVQTDTDANARCSPSRYTALRWRPTSRAHDRQQSITSTTRIYSRIDNNDDNQQNDQATRNERRSEKNEGNSKEDEDSKDNEDSYYSYLDDLTPPPVNFARSSILFSDNPSTKARNNKVLDVWQFCRRYLPPVFTGVWPYRAERAIQTTDANPVGALYNMVFVRTPVVVVCVTYMYQTFVEHHGLVMDLGYTGPTEINPLLVLFVLAVILA